MPTGTADLDTTIAAAGEHVLAHSAVTGERATLLGGWRARRNPDLASHLAHHGAPPLPRAGDPQWPEHFAAAVESAGITGRGGASFPSGTKLRLVGSTQGRRTLIVNVMEGEPASAKDKVLACCVPHLVLDGAELAACALGAARILVCAAAEATDTVGALRRAVAERTGTGQAPVPVEVRCPPGRYTAGEESALVSWLEGGPGVPRWRADKAHPLSIGGNPVLVHNAETLAHMALVARYGPAVFRAAGCADAPGTALVTVSGAVERPGVYEIAMGTALGATVRHARPTDEVTAVLTGGFGGSWLAARTLDTPYAPGPMAAAGGVLGAGVLVVLTRGSCGIAETARLARYLAGESAGQCGPCVFGLPAVADDLHQLAAGTLDTDGMDRLGRRVAQVDGRGACRHPDGAARMVRSAMTVFGVDAAAHAAGRPCAFQNQPSALQGVGP
jgi:NADH:ubiquinone oxidoreductase subunit F (NADH-binding)